MSFCPAVCLPSSAVRSYVRYVVRPQLNTDVSISVQRQRLLKVTGVDRMPRRVRRADVRIDDRLFAAWFSTAGAEEDCAILYLHGGGYCLGSIESHAFLAARLSQAARMPVLLIEYRLAPEAPFDPSGSSGALQDTLNAYRWLLDQHRLDPARIAWAGDSAGGGLAIAGLTSKPRDLPEPAAVACISPWADLTLSGDSIANRGDRDLMLSRAWLEFMANQYLQDHDASDPRVSPVYADLTNLPPLLIQVGSDEILYDDSVALHDRTLACGVSSQLSVADRMWHTWPLFARNLGTARTAIDELATFIRLHLG